MLAVGMNVTVLPFNPGTKVGSTSATGLKNDVNIMVLTMPPFQPIVLVRPIVPCIPVEAEAI